MKKGVKITIILIVILLLLAVFMVVAKLSNGFKTDVKTFFLTVDGEMVTDNATMEILNKPIEVHNLGSKQEFTYSIVRNTSADAFTFYLNEEKHSFAEEENYTKGFEIEKTENGLTVKPASMTTILNRVYGEGEIELPELPNGTCYFTLKISSGDGSKSISLDFAISFNAAGIELDHTHLEF